MSDMWEGFTRNEDGELVLDIYAEPPVDEPEDETNEEYWEYESDAESEDEDDEDEEKHTYATIDCGGDCGGCVALIVDDNVISGPPFHPNCKCTLSTSDIENADYHASHLHQDVASNRNVDTRDVKWLKKALIKLGYYTPNARAGESEKNVNPYPNDQLFEAIDNFRKAKKIKEQGAVKPGHWTEIKINEELQANKADNNKSEQSDTEPTEQATFENPVNTKPGYYAVFDGKTFTLYVDNAPAISWDAVSGQPDYQSPEYQSEKNKGPIPEGTYVARQEKLQFINARDAILGAAAILKSKKGGWPGSYYSWGGSRVWLEPSNETNTYDRDGFSIHGGWVPGSAGCIDLTSQMDNFVALFEFIGKDLIVEVKY